MSGSGAIELRALDDSFGRWDELLAMILRSFAFMEGLIDPPSSVHRLTPSTLRTKAVEETGIVALAGGEIAGCVFVANRGDHCYLGKLAIDTSFQRRGIGRMLMERAEVTARDAAMRTIILETRVELTDNHETFARFGFVETERRAHAGFSRPTFVVMRKELA